MPTCCSSVRMVCARMLPGSQGSDIPADPGRKIPAANSWRIRLKIHIKQTQTAQCIWYTQTLSNHNILFEFNHIYRFTAAMLGWKVRPISLSNSVKFLRSKISVLVLQQILSQIIPFGFYTFEENWKTSRKTYGLSWTKHDKFCRTMSWKFKNVRKTGTGACAIAYTQ